MADWFSLNMGCIHFLKLKITTNKHYIFYPPSPDLLKSQSRKYELAKDYQLRYQYIYHKWFIVIIAIIYITCIKEFVDLPH